MKTIILIVLLLSIMASSYGQQKIIDSLKKVVNQHREDTNTVKALIYLYDLTNYSNLNSAIALSQQGLLLAKKIKYEKGEGLCYIQLANGNSHLGSFSEAIYFNFKALDIYKKLHDIEGMAVAHLSFEVIYKAAGDYRSSLSHAFAVKRLVEESDRMHLVPWAVNSLRWAPLILAEIGDTYERMNLLDSALLFAQKAIKEDQHINDAKWNFPIQVLGRILMKQGKYAPALAALHSAIPLATQNGYPKDTLDVYNSLAILFKLTGNLDSAIYYAKKIIDNGSQISHIKILLEATITLAQVYKLIGDKDNALKYIEFSNLLRDSLYSQEKQREFQNLTFNEQLRQQEIQQQQIQNRNKLWVYILILGLFSLTAIAFILYRANVNKQKANGLLQKQKQEIEQQRTKAESALKELKSMQAQLIQSEKMASLGELTAGIAHEIQNPLNFVNNFSDVNIELIDELEQEADKGNIDEIKTIADDIKENEEKINHHGKRADAIVKGMLQHSRTSTGQKEPIDINALADEYLRLSYHGLRAKDKSFNATIETDFDENIGKIEVIPQDLGRVLLNLFNNAFYAVNEKKRTLTAKGENYEATVWVTTKYSLSFGEGRGEVILSVKDNGIGIPQKAVDKIFQPFFTTKPTGQGTGLGLSLSYDIIKAHGGEIQVQSKEGEESELKVVLPYSTTTNN